MSLSRYDVVYSLAYRVLVVVCPHSKGTTQDFRQTHYELVYVLRQSECRSDLRSFDALLGQDLVLQRLAVSLQHQADLLTLATSRRRAESTRQTTSRRTGQLAALLAAAAARSANKRLAGIIVRVSRLAVLLAPVCRRCQRLVERVRAAQLTALAPRCAQRACEPTRQRA